MAIGTATAIAAAATVGGAVIGANGAKKAAKTQAAAADATIAEQRRQYDQTRADFAPWREAGGAAITSLSDMLGPGYDHTTSPGYQFRFDEGMRAVENSAAARGMLASGGTLKDLVRFGQGVAADDFNDQFNRTASVAAGGQQVNTTLAGLGANTANQVGNALIQQGNARASGYAGQAQAFGGALNSLAGMAVNGGFGGTTSQPQSGWGTPGIY